MAYSVAQHGMWTPACARAAPGRKHTSPRVVLARASRAARSRVPAAPASVRGWCVRYPRGVHSRFRTQGGAPFTPHAIATPSGAGDASVGTDDENGKGEPGDAKRPASGSRDKTKTPTPVNPPSAAEAYEQMLVDRTATMRSNPNGDAAEAIKRRAEVYGSLDDIVLDFDPHMDVAEKLLLVGAFFQDAPTEVAARLAEVTAVATKVYATWVWEEKTNVAFEKRTRGAVVRDGIASLGPVFVKMAQVRIARFPNPADCLPPLFDVHTRFIQRKYFTLVTFTSTRGSYKYITSALFGPITTTVYS
jgi:hypothetical protein